MAVFPQKQGLPVSGQVAGKWPYCLPFLIALNHDFVFYALYTIFNSG
jgi:hypothetical protein